MNECIWKLLPGIGTNETWYKTGCNNVMMHVLFKLPNYCEHCGGKVINQRKENSNENSNNT